MLSVPQSLTISPQNIDWNLTLGTVSTRILFDKTPDGRYTNDALLYQDIIQYVFEKTELIVNENPKLFAFFFNELAGWLVMKKNTEFISYYSDSKSKVNMSNRIAFRRNRIKKCLDNLHCMGLILQCGPVKSRKNKIIDTRIYLFTSWGKIVSYLIKSSNPELSRTEKIAISESVFQLLEESSPLKLLTSESEKLDSTLTCRESFMLRFFRLCYSNELFDEIVRAMWNILLHDSKLRLISGLIDSIVYDHTIYTNKRFRSSVWDIFNQTLESLDEESRSIILFYDKFQIEMGLAEQYKSDSNISGWERLWIKNINNCKKLTVLGYCTNCKKEYPLTIDYFEYKQGIFVLDDREVLVLDCKECNTKESLLISTFVNKTQLFSS